MVWGSLRMAIVRRGESSIGPRRDAERTGPVPARGGSVEPAEGGTMRLRGASARSGGMAYAADSKSATRKGMRVRLPPPGPPLGASTPPAGPMTSTSLQQRFSPMSTCFGCGPANTLGLRIASVEAPGGDFAPGRARGRVAATPPPRGVRRHPQRRDHRGAARLPFELGRGHPPDARDRRGGSTRLRHGRDDRSVPATDPGRGTRRTPRMAGRDERAIESSSTRNCAVEVS